MLWIEIRGLLDPRRLVDERRVIGATVPAEMRRMAAVRRDQLENDEAEIVWCAARIANADRELRAAAQRLIDRER